MKAERQEARAEILQAANRIAIARGRYLRNFVFVPSAHRPVRLYGRRHLQQAVAAVRHFGVVKPEVLAAAGFNPEGGKK
jgi:hypothetical protein